MSTTTEAPAALPDYLPRCERCGRTNVLNAGDTCAACSASAPDLSSLPKRTRLNIAVARTQGWEVWHYPQDETAFLFPPEWFAKWEDVVFVEGDGGKPIAILPLGPPPDYAGDPAAWGALMEREGVWPIPAAIVNDRPSHWRGEGRGSLIVRYLTAECATIGIAICAVVLAKHGIDPTPYIGD